ncbi:Hypothetical predicted protein [Octopus vulgaris]|uniref:Uncharacterized protein n=1 Tax=Octopus vulgaris TaxID=6645 RepID=A0AA36F1U8_OCTVU|nr:Hypothetical predicted protein [Octopus vulgaris]
MLISEIGKSEEELLRWVARMKEKLPKEAERKNEEKVEFCGCGRLSEGKAPPQPYVLPKLCGFAIIQRNVCTIFPNSVLENIF